MGRPKAYCEGIPSLLYCSSKLGLASPCLTCSCSLSTLLMRYVRVASVPTSEPPGSLGVG